MHLRTDHIASAYVVRKPVTDGYVSSLEAYDAQNRLIIQFFGKRIEGHDERPIWRETLATLLRRDTQVAAWGRPMRSIFLTVLTTAVPLSGFAQDV